MKKKKNCLWENSIKLILAAVLVLLCAVVASRTEALAENDREYKITITGGHAQDAKGKLISSAKPGTLVTIKSDGGPGKYWASWESNVELNDDGILGQFIMPEKDVVISAVTVTEQKEFVLDFTNTRVQLSGERAKLVLNALTCIADLNSPLKEQRFDIDNDGNEDFKVTVTRKENGDVSIELDRQPYGTKQYSLGVSYTQKIGDGEIGSLVFTVDNTNTSAGVKVKDSQSYKISVEGGTANCSEAVPGTLIEVRAQIPPEGFYISQYHTADDKFLSAYSQEGLYKQFLFRMPARDISIIFDVEPQVPYELILYKEKTYPQNGRHGVLADLRESLTYYVEKMENARGSWRGNSVYSLDLDGDLNHEIYLDFGDWSVHFKETALTKKSKTVVFDDTGDEFRPKYWPLTIVFSDDSAPTTVAAGEYRITVNGGHAENENGETITSAAPGTKVTVFHDGGSGKYFNGWLQTDYTVPRNTVVFSFTMPEQNVTFSAATTAAQFNYKLNLDESPKIISEYDSAALYSAFLAFDYAADPEYDLDSDGTVDLKIEYKDEQLYIYKADGYSLGESYVWNVPNGHYGPVTITTSADVRTVPSPTPEPVITEETEPVTFIPTPTLTPPEKENAFNLKFIVICLSILIPSAVIAVILVKWKKSPNQPKEPKRPKEPKHPKHPDNSASDWKNERVVLNASSGASNVIKGESESPFEKNSNPDKDSE